MYIYITFRNCALQGCALGVPAGASRGCARHRRAQILLTAATCCS